MPSSGSRVLAGTPEEVFYVGDVPDSATGRLGQVLPGLLAQGGTLGRRSREPVFSIGGFDIIVSGVIDTTRFADGLPTVGSFGQGSPFFLTTVHLLIAGCR